MIIPELYGSFLTGRLALTLSLLVIFAGKAVARDTGHSEAAHEGR